MAGRSNRLLVLVLLGLALVLWRSDLLLPTTTTTTTSSSSPAVAAGAQAAGLGTPRLRAPFAAAAAAAAAAAGHAAVVVGGGRGGHASPPPPPPSPPPPPPLRSFKPSTHAFALEGYNVFDHLYLSHGQLTYAPAVASSAKVVDRADVLSGDKALADARWTQVAEGEAWFDRLRTAADDDEGVQVIPGSTVLLYDGPGPAGYMTPHQHFLPEVFLPALKALSLARPAASVAAAGAGETPPPRLPARVWLPRVEDVTGEKGWRDQEGKNKELIDLLLGPEVELATLADWTALAASGKPVVFERVVVVDRFAAHRHPLTGRWNKMNSAIASLPSTADWFEPYRRQAHRSLDVPLLAEPAEDAKPVVVYLDRNRPNTSPRLTDGAHKALVSALRPLAHEAEIHLVNLPALSAAERLGLLSRARVLLGPRHERELVEGAMWMARGSTVLEIFGEPSLVRDNALVSEMLGLEHLAVQSSRLIAHDAWLELKNLRGPDLGSSAIALDQPELLVRKIRDVLGLE